MTIHRVLSVVTPLGWLVCVGSLAGWASGAALGWIELHYAAALGLLAFALCCLFAVGRTSLRVSVDVASRRLVAGGRTSATVQIANTARQRLLPMALEVPVGPAIERFDVPGLAGGAERTERFTVVAARRGVIPIGPATTVRGDPLGLLRRIVAWPGVQELFVHPTTIALPPLGSGLLRDLEGRSSNDISMSDLAFHTLREYVPGDDRRYIHWRSSAKVGSAVPGGRFLVRQFLDTRRTHLLVIVDGDATAYPDPEHFEIAISAGASIAVRALQDELDTTVLIAGHVAHEATEHRVLDTCARAELGSTRLAELVARGLRIAPETTTALVVTGAAPAFADVRRACAQVPPELRTLALRVDPAAPAGITVGTSLSVLTMRELADLRPLLGRRAEL
ncbi:hypothetical protein Lfu02_21750 [Longispora fulva]|uniref:Uncharacterized protein (DUF58 family) n=1 Tax=Longispora fulva TaxID=619741 RepID=A0A8J7GY80_9ACTN|nr:DUF58 domain-containing protein [Longispora fulva]MBG6139813.1 uncharacterized protein (DUF58 family) [Longispora fulva]GIG57803.1 hypothetical protein Lfu02_21750 [Longispora fulva]